jgi:hypothetical protein
MTTVAKTAPAAGAFDALLAEIGAQSNETETLAKAIKGDDAAIAAAAAEGDEGPEGETKEEKAARMAAMAEGGEGKPVMKALKVIDENGDESDALDAGEILKALQAGQVTLEANSAAGLKAVLGVVAAQGELIKSLHEQVSALGQSGRGRRSVLAIAEKPGATEDLSKALTEEKKSTGMPREEFFSKALDAAKSGAISYHDVNHSETLVNGGGVPLPQVIKAVQDLVGSK